VTVHGLSIVDVSRSLLAAFVFLATKNSAVGESRFLSLSPGYELIRIQTIGN
jgi:hypothetical protein